MSCKRMTVAKPLTARPANFKYNVCRPKITDIPRKSTPAKVTRCNGKDEKAVIPMRASFSRFLYGPGH